jgi:hypothetical protein
VWAWQSTGTQREALEAGRVVVAGIFACVGAPLLQPHL